MNFAGTCLVTFVMLFFLSPFIQASPNALTYQGRILKADGTPLSYGNTSFLFEITSPNGSCVIYREQRDGVNMLNSGGVFDVPIGSGTKLFPTNPLITLLDSFNNSKTHDCYGGATYSAAVGDIRLLKVQFHDGSGWKLISPSNEIRSVPYSAYALSAQKLGTKTENDFFVKTGVPNCAANEFLTWNGSVLSCAPVNGASGGTVTNVTSANSYVTITNNTSTPLVTLNVGTAANTVAAGNDARFTDARIPTGAAGGDLGGTYPNPSVAKIQNVAVSNIAPTNGQFLKFDGTQWGGSAIGMSDVTNLNATLSNYHTVAAFNTAVGSANCAAHQTPYWNSVSSSFQCQAINVSVAGDVSGTIGAVSVNKIKGVDVDTTGLAGGQILKYDGIKWAPAADSNAGGTVTNIATGTGLSGGPITSTGTISLANTAVTAGAYGSTTQVGTFTVDAQGRLTAASNTAIAFPVTSVATKTGAVILDYGDINSAASKYLTYKPNNVACTDGQVIKWVAVSSRWECANDTDTNAGGTVTNVTSANSYLSVATGTTTPALTVNVGTVANTVAAGNDARFTDARTPTGAAGGDLSGTYPNPAVAKLQTTPVSATVPTSGQVLKFDGINWAPAADNNAGGTVTNIATGTGLSGGPITSTGTISLANTAVIAGSYTRANITVDAQGRLTAASNGAAVNLGTEVTGTLPIANGGTGQTSALAAFNALSPLTTKGDIIVRDVSNNIRLPAGLDGQVLSANSVQASGLQWITPTNGTVTNVTGTAPIVVATGSTTPAISISDATTAAKGAVQVGSGIAVSAGTISADPANFPSAVPVSKGGTGVTSLTANRLLASNGTGSAVTIFNCAVGQMVSFDTTGMMICSAFTTGSVFLNGGNSFAGDATLGTNDNFALNFETNGATKMAITPAGNVGIGTTTPATHLHVVAPSSGETIRSHRYVGANSWGNMVRLYQARGTASSPLASVNGDALVSLDFGGYDGSAFVDSAQIVAWSNGAISAGSIPTDLLFLTGSSGGGTEKMRVTSGGNVGIGIPGPGYKLHVDGIISTQRAAANESRYHVYNAGSVAEWLIGQKSGTDHNLTFTKRVAAVDTDYISVTPGGLVGIGTTSPGSALHVAGSAIVGTQSGSTNDDADYYLKSNGQLHIQANQSGSADPNYVHLILEAGTATSANSSILMHTLGAERMRVTSTGNVGIGTTSPSGQLANTSTNTGDSGTYAAPTGTGINANSVNWTGAGAGYIGQFVNSGSAATSNGVNIYTVASDSGSYVLNARSNGNSRFVVRADGNVGIGTSTPSQMLQVQGSALINAIYGGHMNGSGNFHLEASTAGADRAIYLNWYTGTGGAKVGNGAASWGPISASAFNTSSDRRLKENIQPLSTPLEKVLSLEPVTFTWKDKSRNKMEGTRLGLIAQNVEKVFPQAVRTDRGENTLPGGTKLVTYPDLIAPLIGAIKEFYSLWWNDSKELHKTVEKQSREMASIKEENSQIKAENDRIKKENDEIKARLERLEKQLSK